jgi:hypothetical protein
MPDPQIKEVFPAPPKDMLDMIIFQMQTAIDTTPAPKYVKKATSDFIDALKRWGAGEQDA